MAGSPLKRARKQGIRLDDGSVVAVPRTPRVADLPKTGATSRQPIRSSICSARVSNALAAASKHGTYGMITPVISVLSAVEELERRGSDHAIGSQSRRSLRALAMARRATWRERAMESVPVPGATVTSVRKALLGLPRMPRTGGAVLASGRSGDIIVNQLQCLLSKNF